MFLKHSCTLWLTFCCSNSGGYFNDHDKVFAICQNWHVGSVRSQIERIISTELRWLFITKLIILPDEGLFDQKQLSVQQN